MVQTSVLRPAARWLGALAAVAGVLLGGGGGALAQRPPRGAAKPAAAAPFTTTLTADQLKHKQAVLETDRGTIVIDLLPEHAPNHVGYFMKLAGEGAYDGTTFHRAIKYGIVQGGDPLSKDAAKRTQYGTGGLGVLKKEAGTGKASRGAVAAVLQPGKPDSGGAQFFICVTDQPALDGQYTVFGAVSDGIEIVQAISEAPVDGDGKLTGRLAIRKVTIRDTPPEPFTTQADAELGRYRAIVDTTMGAFTIEFLADQAPGHVRAFLRLAELGVYTGTAFHRVKPGFVVQTGLTSTRTTPLTERQRAWVKNLPPEFNDTPHVRGTVSMARLEAPDSAQTSFFVVLAPQPSLDRQYTVFGRVAAGMDVIDAMEDVPVNGEAPVTRIEITGIRLEMR
jgi:peptidyl-prolyl cis-trans isomerase B (cyclophilin B)